MASSPWDLEPITWRVPIGGLAPIIARRIFAVLFTAFALLLLLAPLANAEPAKITQAKDEAAALRGQVESLDHELEKAREDAAYAQWQLEQTTAEIADKEAKLEKAEADLAVASERLSNRVQGIYRKGKVSFWEAIFTVDSITDLFNRLDHLNRIGEQEGDLLQQIEHFQVGVTQQREELKAQKEQEKRLAAEMKAAESSAETKLAERKRLLAGKEDQIARLEREEAERQARLAAQRRQEAQRAAAAAAASESSASGSSSGGSSGGSSSAPARSVPRSIKGGSAVDYAMSMIGVPYVWGGESPSGFDCSGLTKWAYAQVGVSLPHSSRAQFGYGTPVSRSQLQPGDLVFFGSPIHHVGMYVGNGSMVHAPYTGSTVRVRSISRSDYAGARRM